MVSGQQTNGEGACVVYMVRIGGGISDAIAKVPHIIDRARRSGQVVEEDRIAVAAKAEGSIKACREWWISQCSGTENVGNAVADLYRETGIYACTKARQEDGTIAKAVVMMRGCGTPFSK